MVTKVGRRAGKRKLTSRQSLFLDYLLTGMRHDEAYLKAGFTCKPEHARSRAARTLTLDYVREEFERRQEERRERILRKIEREADASVETIKEVRDSSELDFARLSAAKDLLDRAGYKPPERHEVESKSLIVVVVPEEEE